LLVEVDVFTEILAGGALLGASALWATLRARNLHLWVGAHIRDRLTYRLRKRPGTVDVYFCFADHYEPYGHGATREHARARVQRWVEHFPPAARRHRDSDGRHPVHSFFYPAEEYDPELLDQLKTICAAGIGDVELHLHHDNDTADSLERMLNQFKTVLHERHGFLRLEPETGEIVYCFIHGNWALDNSRPDGRYCGVDNELEVLLRTGCRCDMTMPSAPSDTQTSKINSIYFARGRPGLRKAHDRGRDAALGQWGAADELLLIQGPLCLNWRRRKFGVLPRIESAEISHDAPPTAQRAALWERCGIGVHGVPGHLFIKVHGHGAVEATMDMLFGGGFDTLWGALEGRFRDRPGYRLHYVSAWEMVRKVRELATPPTSGGCATNGS
jgi:hypothetical protein